MSKQLYLLLLCVCFVACRTLPTRAGKGKVRLVHTFRGEKFELNKPYITLLGDTVLFTKFKYYWHLPDVQTYKLIDLEDTLQKTVICKHSPTFGIGIEAKDNTQGTQQGVLDPLQGMFWTWEQGYAFIKVEGYFSPYLPTKTSFVLHMGSNENYLPLAYPAQTKEITIQTEKIFGGYAGAGIDLKNNGKPLSLMAGEKIKLLKVNLRAVFGLF